MISRELKSLYYTLARVPMAASARAYRSLRSPSESDSDVRVHLGPGQRNYLDGWINVDANIISSRPDVWSDLRDVLPFRNGTVDVFYSHHVIEHLPDALLPFHLAELYRCLKEGGIVRIGGPNGDVALEKLQRGDAAWFPDFPDQRRSVGGRFANFILCRGEHLTILTFSYLQELLEDAGFAEIKVCRPGLDTCEPRWIDEKVFAMEPEPTPEAPHTLLVEARKVR